MSIWYFQIKVQQVQPEISSKTVMTAYRQQYPADDRSREDIRQNNTDDTDGEKQ
jgi:hypothetical protein